MYMRLVVSASHMGLNEQTILEGECRSSLGASLFRAQGNHMSSEEYVLTIG
jgi:hypothetical protein